MDTHRQTFIYLSSLICVWMVLAENEKLYGLHSDELASGYLVIPRRVNRAGEFLTNNLIHYHDVSYQQTHRQRSKRNAASAATAATGQDVHYQLDINNQTLHLQLEPHNYFMTPHLIIERHRRDLRTRKKPDNNTNCHFHGQIRGQTESRVAISTCKGLIGHIKTKNNEYYIEPSKEHDAHPVHGHPHVVFHRSSIKEKPNRTTQRQRKLKEYKMQQQEHRQQNKHQKALKKHSRQHARAAMSNCGTKEPRRFTETRLEWQSQGKIKIQGGRKIRRRHHRQNHNIHRHNHQHHHHRRNHNGHDGKSAYVLAEDFRPSAASASASALATAKQKYEISSNDKKTNNKNINRNTNNNQRKTNIQLESPASSSSMSSSSSHHHHHHHHQHHRLQRRKRSISSPRHVEALLVADPTMVSFHDDVETYLLTIMNMVSSLYKDPSIGNSIEVVVVKIILLEEDEAARPDLNLTQNAQQNLDTFCSWQRKLNTDNENDPHHHDVAILITRKNICGNNCMTLGLANVGGMCNPKQSCSVNEDNGIMLSHTIAHELGHNFGMFHDSAKIGCHPRVGSIVHIMTPTFGADTLQVSWSNCSRKFITQFLDQGLGECLDDAPTPLDQYVYPELPPGVLYNAELQCRLQFNLTDPNVGPCSSMNEICSALWCRVNGECVTNMRPTAPGTSCGKRKWCQNGKCVRKTELTPIDGGWGNWSQWSECSRSCGGGISIQKRECNNPVPANGGLFCIGERKRYKICEKNPCPLGEPNFRAKQCSLFNDRPYQGSKYRWMPFFDKDNPCKLLCTDEDDTIIANWGDVVLDGTPCTLGTNNMCIDGICKKVGCDWIVDSDLQEDRCGICGGQGDQCKPVKEIFSDALNITEGYVEIVTIPGKARHIVIKELSDSPNFLAIADANTGNFYLNGDNLISMPGEFIIAGAESLYDRVDEREVIKIPQPIEHSIALFAIIRNNVPIEGGIYYEFTLPVLNMNDSGEHRYEWRLSDWSSCTASCGSGVQYQEAKCYRNEVLTTHDELCWSYGKNKRPTRLTRPCNERQCPVHWWAGPWQFCPVTCWSSLSPPGYHVKKRSVVCLDQNEVVVEDFMCPDAIRPAEFESCEDLPECFGDGKSNDDDSKSDGDSNGTGDQNANPTTRSNVIMPL